MTLGSGIPTQALGISTSYLLAFELLIIDYDSVLELTPPKSIKKGTNG